MEIINVVDLLRQWITFQEPQLQPRLFEFRAFESLQQLRGVESGDASPSFTAELAEIIVLLPCRFTALDIDSQGICTHLGKM